MTDKSRLDRNVAQKTTLYEQDDQGIIRDATPAQRMAMVWQLTLDLMISEALD